MSRIFSLRTESAKGRDPHVERPEASKHLKNHNAARRQSKELGEQIKNSKSPKERAKLQQEKHALDQSIKNHEKEMDQKWDGWRNKSWKETDDPYMF